MNKEMINITEFSKMANITEPYARQLLREEVIKGVKVGKEWRIPRLEVNKYLGIEVDKSDMEKEIYIKQLESEVKHYKFIIQTLKSNFNNISSILNVG